MTRRAARLGVPALIALGLAGVGCFVMLAGAETPGERAVDAAVFLVLVASAAVVSFLCWPRSAR